MINVFTARSRDAVINANPIVLRSPVTGILESLTVRTGVEVRTGQTLAIVVNPMATRDAHTDLETQLETARGRLEELRTRRDLRRKLVAQLNLDARQQRSLEISRNQNERDNLGFALDRARTTEQQRAREVRGLEAQLAGQLAVLKASNNDLTLRNNRSNPIRWCGFRRPPSPWRTPKAMCAPRPSRSVAWSSR